MFLNNRLLKESKNFSKQMAMRTWQLKNLWDAAKAVLRGKFIAIQSYLKKQKKTLNRQPNVTPKTTGKRRKKLVEGKKS